MLLRSITYNNFRIFKGSQKVVLRSSKDKQGENVVVLIGDNTGGKTTFVLSFIWCLYGESRFQEADSILNKKVEKEMRCNSSETASVEIEFEDSGKIYTMRRQQHFFKDAEGKLSPEGKPIPTLSYQTENGETRRAGKYPSDYEVAIRTILPFDLSSFFFFEGEKSNQRSQANLRKDVETLIGLEALQAARSHIFGNNQNRPAIDSVMGQYFAKQKDDCSTQADAEYNQYEDAEKKAAQATKDIEGIKENIRHFEEKIQNIHNLQVKAAPSIEMRNNIENNNKNKKELEKRIEEESLSFVSAFGAESLPLFIYPFLAKLEDALKQLKIDDKGIKGLEASAIYALLEKGKCLCGTSLMEGSIAYNNVKEYINYVPPRHLGNLVSDLLDNAKAYDEDAKKFVKDFQGSYRQIVSLKEKLHECESISKELLERIRSTENFDTTEIDRLPEYQEKLANLHEQLQEKTAERAVLGEESKKHHKAFEELTAKNDRSQKYRKYYQYAETIYKWIENILLEKKSVIREKLEIYVQELFNKIYTGKRDVLIDEKYNISLTYEGGRLDTSGGLEAIKYFSYVAALIKVACEMMDEKNGEEDSPRLGELYPLVLDAAFSHTDETHTKNIARELAKAVPQLIFAVMYKDWDEAKEGLVNKIARTYHLEKLDEEETKIKQLDL